MTKTFDFPKIDILDIDGNPFSFDAKKLAENLYRTAPSAAEHIFATDLYKSISKDKDGKEVHKPFEVKVEDIPAIEAHVLNSPYAFFVKQAIVSYLKTL